MGVSMLRSVTSLVVAYVLMSQNRVRISKDNMQYILHMQVRLLAHNHGTKHVRFVEHSAVVSTNRKRERINDTAGEKKMLNLDAVELEVSWINNVC